MRLQAFGSLLVLLTAMVLLPSAAEAQSQMAGIAVDADGVLHKRVIDDPTGQLTSERRQAARMALSPDLASFSRLRKISLNRLEAELKQRQGVPTDEMRYLAGIQRIRYVFFYPETGDIVVAGPAEGWMTDPTGRVVGMKNGRPTLQLQDLVVALRAFPPSGSETSLVGCSIDPTPEGLAAMQQFLVNVGQTITPDQTDTIVAGLQESLGPQRYLDPRGLVEDPLRPDPGRGRLSDETDRHRSGTTADPSGQLRRSGQPEPGRTKRLAAMVLRSRLSVCPHQ